MPSIGNPGRFAGLLYVLTSIVGFFAMGYVPDKLIVHGNAAATVNNIAAHEMLFRFGIAGQLIGQAAFIFVALALYDLLKGINQRHAWLMVILIVVSIPIAFVNELNHWPRSPSCAGLTSSPSSKGPSGMPWPCCSSICMVADWLLPNYFGVLAFPLALLVYRSRFLPRFGVWLALAGAAWVILSLASIRLPQYQNKVYTYTQPAVFGEIAFMLWLFIKGAKPPALAAEPQRLHRLHCSG